jgi:hypothetical protein
VLMPMCIGLALGQGPFFFFFFFFARICIWSVEAIIIHLFIISIDVAAQVDHLILNDYPLFARPCLLPRRLGTNPRLCRIVHH